MRIDRFTQRVAFACAGAWGRTWFGWLLVGEAEYLRKPVRDITFNLISPHSVPTGQEGGDTVYGKPETLNPTLYR